MNLFEVLGIAVGLAMDAFAVCLGVGAAGHAPRPRPAVRLAFHFGLFQFLMPVIGWLAGATLAAHFGGVDHWIAFGLLLLVGTRMIRAGFAREPETYPTDPTRGLTMVMLSVAVSLDALAVGGSLAMVGITIWQPSAIIGIVTGALSLAGIVLGNQLGSRLGRQMEIVGGVLLVGIGLLILLQHR